MIRLPPLPSDVSAGQIPDWDVSSLLHRPCPACGADSPKELIQRPDSLMVHVCSTCGMTYVAEVPEANIIQEFYGSYRKFKHCSDKRLGWSHRLLASRNRYIQILEQTGGIFGRCVCEVGCGYGGFLELLRFRGGNVFGVEIDDAALGSLKRKGIPHSREVHRDSQFDIVCMLQVLEHLANPGEILTDISRALPLDGRLLLSLPNGGELNQVGETWIGLRVDLEHLNYFSIATLARLLERHGLVVEQFWLHDQPAIQRLAAARRPSYAHRIAGGLHQVLSVLGIGEAFAAGSFVMTVLIRKV